MKRPPFIRRPMKRCSYCGSRTHIVQFCPKTHAGMVRIEQRAAELARQQEATPPGLRVLPGPQKTAGR